MPSSILLYLSTFLLVFIIYLSTKLWNHILITKKVKRALNKFPSRKAHWFFGHLMEMPRSFGQEFIDYFRNCAKEHPRAEAFLLGTWWVGYLRLWHPDTIKPILKTAEPKFIKSGNYQHALDWFGNGILMGTEAAWARSRKLMTPAFHLTALRQFVDIKNQCAEALIERLLKLAHKTEKSLEMFEIFKLTASDVLLRCAVSYEGTVNEKKKMDEYFGAVKILTKLWTERTLQPWLFYNWVYNLTSSGKQWNNHLETVKGITKQILEKRKNNQEENRNKDILDILLSARDEDGKGLSDEEIENELNTIIFAGHDTTSSALSWISFRLAKHPELQAKCQQEVDDILEGRETETITHEDLKKLSYLTMFIKETMRIDSIIPFVERELSRPLTIDGIELPEYTMIAIYFFVLNFNEEVWNRPWEFNPERFSPENIEKMDSFAFVPFSAGPRNCIGQNFVLNEIKIVLARLLRKITFKLDHDRLPKPLVSIVMKSENGMHLYVEKRTR